MSKQSKPYTFSRFGAEIKPETRVKVIHATTKQFLHSSGLKYNTGSQQQQVDAVEDQADQGNWWVVRCGDAGFLHEKSQIRLTHQVTGANLHSHKGVKSPASKQQEVTCFGAQGNGDQNDYWILDFAEDYNKQWGLDHIFRTGAYFALYHCESKHYLHSHHGLHTQDHKQEVTAFNGKDDNNLWYVWVAE